MVSLGPVVFCLGWPWIWSDTGERLADYVAFHLNHEYYNMEFLGVTYFRPPYPRLYAWVMTVATVPTITLLLFALGLGKSALELPFLRRIRALSFRERRAAKQLFSTRTLWILCLFTSYAPWLSAETPIFGGTKHWITAYPFMCLFAGTGFEWTRQKLVSLWASREWKRRHGAGARGFGARGAHRDDLARPPLGAQRLHAHRRRYAGRGEPGPQSVVLGVHDGSGARLHQCARTRGRLGLHPRYGDG